MIIRAAQEGRAGHGRPHERARPGRRARDAKFREILNSFDIVASDGQPVRWALNLFHKTGLKDRVYGPELTIRLCKAAAEQGVSIYLYGSSPEVIEKLQANLRDKFPAIKIAGAETPAVPPAHAGGRRGGREAHQRQRRGDRVHRHRLPQAGDLRLRAPRIRSRACSSASAPRSTSTPARRRPRPAWMQKRGLEWLFRLTQEPKRLWKRYLVTNTMFSLLVGRRFLLGR